MTQPNWKEIAEATGIVAILVSLVVLIVEVRENTLAIERQTAIDRAASITEPFFDSEMPEILAKIKAVDGEEQPHVIDFMDTYDLSYAEAYKWERHLWFVWEILEAEYLFSGVSDELNNQIRGLLVNRDNQIYIDSVLSFRFSADFGSHILELQKGLDQWEKSMDAKRQ